MVWMVKSLKLNNNDDVQAVLSRITKSDKFSVESRVEKERRRNAPLHIQPHLFNRMLPMN